MYRIRRIAISFLLIAAMLTGHSAVASYAGEETEGSLVEAGQQSNPEDSSIDGEKTTDQQMAQTLAVSACSPITKNRLTRHYLQRGLIWRML